MSPIQLPSETPPAEYDVIVVGGGPVGLVLGYQLARFNISVCVLEKHDKERGGSYGRAITLFPRTCELLEQIDLIQPMLQQGYPGRVWTFMENITGTAFDFALVLRQMYTETILREKLQAVGAAYYLATECVDYEIDPDAGNNYPVTVACIDNKTQSNITLKGKYLVGADGGRSFVRKQANIPFDGDTSEDQWIRIDGIVETDMPISRAYGAIESKTHGNVLWAPLDHGATRIGYAYTPEIAARYPDGVTQEVAETEAIRAMAPFHVRFTEVHWWTLYKISQRMARTFSSGKHIFLCGDAAHTHSSGAAQGLNTGIHDAVNLAWKLALQIRGLSRPAVIETYGAERKEAVEKLINYDKDIALLMTHKWPSWYQGDPTADPYMVLGEIFDKAASFNTGLGISYAENAINRSASVRINPASGSRAPDVEVLMPGLLARIRLHQVLRNAGAFQVLVFTGRLDQSQKSLLDLRGYLDENSDLYCHKAIRWFTITPVIQCSAYEAVGMNPFGDAYFDPDGRAHLEYGIDMEQGAVVVVRPDGLVAFGCDISGPSIRNYFENILQF
ncbi:hypothetical protein HFD88_005046 [Aspergillus terreus]|nr:hypothetical protein HFD88_005046 [Aspergillus terreus]